MAAAPVNTETLLFFHLGVDVERPEAGREASEGEILPHQLVQELVLAHSQSLHSGIFNCYFSLGIPVIFRLTVYLCIITLCKIFRTSIVHHLN